MAIQSGSGVQVSQMLPEESTMPYNPEPSVRFQSPPGQDLIYEQHAQLLRDSRSDEPTARLVHSMNVIKYPMLMQNETALLAQEIDSQKDAACSTAMPKPFSTKQGS